MCTDAYREALTRDFSSTASSAPAPAPVPDQRQAGEAGREGVAERPLRRRTNPGQDDLESRGVLGGGTLPRKELKQAAAELTADQAGLVAVGEPTIEEGVDKALTGAAKVVKHTMDATTDEITSELQEALKS